MRIAAHMESARPMTTEFPPCDKTVRPAESVIYGWCPTQFTIGFYPIAKPPATDEYEGWQPAGIYRTSA